MAFLFRGRARWAAWLVAILAATFVVAVVYRRSRTRGRPPAVVSPLPASRAGAHVAMTDADAPAAGVASQPFREVVVGRSLTVRVVDPNGVELRESEVYLVDRTDAPRAVRRDGGGRFAVGGDEKEIVAACRGYIPGRFELTSLCPEPAVACDVVLHRGRELRGVVVDQAGRPLAGALVEAAGREPAEFQGLQDVGLDPQSVAGTGPDAAFVRRARTSEDGRFEFDGLSAGRLHLRASLFGYLPDSIWGWVRVEPEGGEGEQRVKLRRVFVSVVCVEPHCPLGRVHRRDEVAVSARWPESLANTETIEELQTAPILAALTRRFAESRPISVALGKAMDGMEDCDVSIRGPGNAVFSVTGASFSVDRIWVPLDRITGADIAVVRAFDGCGGHGTVRGRSAMAMRAVRVNSSGRPGGLESVPINKEGDVQVFDVPAGKYVLRSYGGEALGGGRRDTEPFEVLPEKTYEFDLTEWSKDLRRVDVSVRDRYGRPTSNYGVKFESDKGFVGTVLGQVKGPNFALWLPKSSFRLVLLDAMSERASVFELAPDVTEARLKL
jgi:hypothetical protein